MSTSISLPRPSTERLAWPSPQRWGGIAALTAAATYVVGFATMAAYLLPEGYVETVADPAGSLDFLLGHQTSLYLWYALLYLVGGVAHLVLVVGIHDRVSRSEPALSAFATATGLVWSGLLLASGMVALLGQRAAVELAASDRALAESTWTSTGVVQDALGGGIELVGGLWVLLVAVAALRSHMFSRGLAWLGLTIALAGVATVVPSAADGSTALFGLGFIVWFAWAGHALLRR